MVQGSWVAGGSVLGAEVGQYCAVQGWLLRLLQWWVAGPTWVTQQ